MPPPCFITFLGTASAVPTQMRNQTALAFSIPNGDTWLFDCGEGTQLQIQKTGGRVKMGRISRIFITHMHGDHIFGLSAFMATRMNGAGGSEDDHRVLQPGSIPADQEPEIELYGPVGLRRYLRESFKLTYTRLDGFYAVHELHPSIPESSSSPSTETPYEKELPGRDIFPDADGIWRDITLAGKPKKDKKKVDKEWVIDAGSILHSVPSVGFVLVEPPLPGSIPPEYKNRLLGNAAELEQIGVKNPLVLLSKLSSEEGGYVIDLPDGTKLEKPPSKLGRKIVILGDTCDPSPIAPAAMDADILVHEATNAFLKQDVIENTKGGYQGLEAWTVSRGHSTPEMAGRFARKIRLGSKARAFTLVDKKGKDSSRAEATASKSKKKDGDDTAQSGKGCLLLNHFSSRYPDPRVSEEAASIMEEIRVCGENGYRQHVLESTLLVDKSDAAVLAETPNPQTEGHDVLELNDIGVLCAFDCMRLEIRAVK